MKMGNKTSNVSRKAPEKMETPKQQAMEKKMGFPAFTPKKDIKKGK